MRKSPQKSPKKKTKTKQTTAMQNTQLNPSFVTKVAASLKNINDIASQMGMEVYELLHLATQAGGQETEVTSSSSGKLGQATRCKK